MNEPPVNEPHDETTARPEADHRQPPPPPWATSTPPPGPTGPNPSTPSQPGFSGYGGPSAPATPATPRPQRPTATRPHAKRSKLPFIGALALVALIAGIAAVVAIGGDNKGASDGGRTPTGTVEAFTQAVEASDSQTFCRLLSNAQREQVTVGFGGRCVEAAGPLLTLAGALDVPEIEVTGSAVDGDRATVSVLVAGSAGEIPLVKEDGRWVIDASPGSLIGGTTTDQPGSVTSPDPAACTTDLRTVQTAMEAYLVQNGEYPAGTEALVDAGLLSHVPTNVRVTPDGTATLIGDCA